MGNRYDNRLVIRNEDESYDAILEERNVPFIRQFATSTMIVPTSEQRANLTRTRHIWKVGDRFYKLALTYYNDAQYWWVIALFNEKPTEAQISIGDVLEIPQPLNETLRIMRG